MEEVKSPGKYVNAAILLMTSIPVITIFPVTEKQIIYRTKRMFKKTQPTIKTMDELVSTFTSDAQSIADAQAEVVSLEDEKIKLAQSRRDAAQGENDKANKFIKNFAALAGSNTK
jgi:hypothetical protein